MVKKSLMYRNRLIYSSILKVIHGSNFSKRYRYMASLIKKGETILEPACGPAILADFLPENCFYSGFDVNKEFINFALKKKLAVYSTKAKTPTKSGMKRYNNRAKGRTRRYVPKRAQNGRENCGLLPAGIYLGNVMDYKNYKKSDVVVACDILHHLKPKNRKTFINYCFNSARKRLIICEPGRNDDLWLLKKFVFEFLEKDGANQPKYSQCYSEEKLKKEMENGFSVIPKSFKRKIKGIGGDLIAVYFKS